MKKILQSLMTLAMLLGITQFGQAQETTYSVTVDWGIPRSSATENRGQDNRRHTCRCHKLHRYLH